MSAWKSDEKLKSALWSTKDPYMNSFSPSTQTHFEFQQKSFLICLKTFEDAWSLRKRCRDPFVTWIVSSPCLNNVSNIWSLRSSCIFDISYPYTCSNKKGQHDKVLIDCVFRMKTLRVWIKFMLKYFINNNLFLLKIEKACSYFFCNFFNLKKYEICFHKQYSTRRELVN